MGKVDCIYLDGSMRGYSIMDLKEQLANVGFRKTNLLLKTLRLPYLTFKYLTLRYLSSFSCNLAKVFLIFIKYV